MCVFTKLYCLDCNYSEGRTIFIFFLHRRCSQNVFLDETKKLASTSYSSTLSWNTDLKRKSTLEEIFSQGKTTLLPQTGTMGLTPCPRPPKCYREAEHGWTLGQSVTSTAASQTQESQKGAEKHWKQEGHLEARGDGQVTGWLPSGRATWRPGFPNATAPDPEPSRCLLWFRFRSSYTYSLCTYS